jgi:hypothetical protein
VKVWQHFHIAELKGGVVTPGHTYNYKTEPSAHYNHVHVAYDDPWGEPDSPGAHPPNNCPNTTKASQTFRDAVAKKFPGRYRWNGGCVFKHRNSSNSDPWSQHAFGNADDFMANYGDQDDLLNWLNSEWQGEEDDLNEKEHDWLKTVYDFVADLKGGEGGGISAQGLADNGDFHRGFRNRIAFETGADTSLKKPTDKWAAIGWDFAASFLGSAQTE